MIFTVAVRVFIVWFYNNTGKSVFAAPSSMIWSTSVMAYFLTTACIMTRSLVERWLQSGVW